MDEEDEKDSDEDKCNSQQQHPSTSSAANSSMPFGSYQRSSRIVSQALAGRKLDELSTNELTQVIDCLSTD